MSSRIEMSDVAFTTVRLAEPGETIGVDTLESHGLVIEQGVSVAVIVGNPAELRVLVAGVAGLLDDVLHAPSEL